MFELITATLLASSFTTYQGYGDQVLASPQAAAPTARIEAAVDKGLIVEMIVRCPDGTGIITYSKVEHLYCSPQHECDSRLAVVAARTCR